MKKIISISALFIPLSVFAAADPDSLIKLIDDIALWLFFIIGALGTIFIALAALKFMTAQGEESKLSDARKTLFWSLVGIAIEAAAYFLKETVIIEVSKFLK